MCNIRALASSRDALHSSYTFNNTATQSYILTFSSNNVGSCAESSSAGRKKSSSAVSSSVNFQHKDIGARHEEVSSNLVQLILDCPL